MQALFRASLPHPTADHDYALYEVGEGCDVLYLIPGVDLLSEKSVFLMLNYMYLVKNFRLIRFRVDGRSFVAAMRFVMDELHRSKHNLFVRRISL
jgi:hypothetical protein